MKILTVIHIVLLFACVSSAQTTEEAVTLFEEEQYGMAEQILKAIIKQTPGDVKAQLYLGKIYKVKGQFDRAENQLRRAMNLDPKYLDVYMELGRLMLEWPRRNTEDRWRWARLYYQKAVDNIPTASDALLLLFESYIRTGEAEKGQEAMIDFFNESPDSLANYLANAVLIKATEHNMLRRTDALYDFYINALNQNPTKPADLYEIGWGFFTCGDLDAALSVYKEGMKYDDAVDYSVYFDMMVFTYELRVYDESLVYFLKGYAMTPSENRSMLKQPEDLPDILVRELERDFGVGPEEFLEPEWGDNISPDMVLRKLRHYSIVWLRSKTHIERREPYELSGRITFEEPYLIHWGQYNFVDYAFHFLLDNKEKERFLLYTIPEQRETFRERFFRQKDPTPTNDVNEIRDLFAERIEYVCETFKILPNPDDRMRHIRDFSGFDDRGRVYLKYGEPGEYYIDPGGTKRVANTIDRAGMELPPVLVDDIQTRGRGIETSGGSGLPIIVKPNMTWYYINYDRYLFFDFVELEKGYFTLVDDLADAAGGHFDAWLLYMNRAYEGGMTGIYESYLYEYDREFIESSGIFVIDFLLPDLNKKDDVTENYPTNIVDVNINVNPLFTSLDFATFRGESGATRLEVYTGVSYSNLKFESVPDQSPTATLGYTVVVKDVEINPVVMDTITSGIQLASGEKAGEQSALHQFRFEMDPGAYNVNVRSENPESGKVGTYVIDTPVPSYAGNSLMISDIQFASQIQPAEPGDPFVKNGLMVVPYPFRQVDRKNPISFYLEIYNLGQRPDGTSSFDITYTANVVEPNQGIMDKLKALMPGAERTISRAIPYSRTGSGPDYVEYLAFDISNLIPGGVELTVEVSDKISGQTVSKTFRFRVF